MARRAIRHQRVVLLVWSKQQRRQDSVECDRHAEPDAVVSLPEPVPHHVLLGQRAEKPQLRLRPDVQVLPHPAPPKCHCLGLPQVGKARAVDPSLKLEGLGVLLHALGDVGLRVEQLDCLLLHLQHEVVRHLEQLLLARRLAALEGWPDLGSNAR